MGKSKRKNRSSGSDSGGRENKGKLFKYGGLSNCDDGNIPLSAVISETNAVLFEGDSQFNVSVTESEDNSSVFLKDGSPSPLNKSAVSVMAEQTTSRGMNAASRGPARTGTQVNDMTEPSIKDVIQYLHKINSRIELVDKKLERIKILETKVDRFEVELNKLWNHLHDKDKKSDEKINSVIDKCESIDFNSGLVNERIILIEQERDKLKDEVTYLQSQSMRNNLVFSNLEESRGELPEDTEQVLRKFLNEKMKIAKDLVDKLVFERVHRMGYSNRGKPRQIVAKFNLFKERELVRKQWKALEGTQYYVNEQFPREVVEKRRKLKPKLIEAKQKGQRAWFAYDTLYIDGKAVKYTDS